MRILRDDNDDGNIGANASPSVMNALFSLARIFFLLVPESTSLPRFLTPPSFRKAAKFEFHAPGPEG